MTPEEQATDRAMVQLARDASTPAPVIPARVTAGTVLRSTWRALGRLR